MIIPIQHCSIPEWNCDIHCKGTISTQSFMNGNILHMKQADSCIAHYKYIVFEQMNWMPERQRGLVYQPIILSTSIIKVISCSLYYTNSKFVWVIPASSSFVIPGWQLEIIICIKEINRLFGNLYSDITWILPLNQVHRTLQWQNMFSSNFSNKSWSDIQDHKCI